MALLSQVIRSAAITGSTDTTFVRIAGRQGGAWAERTVRAAFPAVGPHAERAAAAERPADPAAALRELTSLYERGALTDAEFEQLRAGLNL
jgi:hypothetical protein